MNELQKILSPMRRAVEKYGMIEKGDKIAVGVSGGKDSLVLLSALAVMRRFAEFSYDIVAVTVDNGFENASPDYFDEVTKFCSSLGVEHRIIKTDIAKIVFEHHADEKPCSLCASLRRGALYREAESLGCTAIALGHHLDDVCETYIMNIMMTGRAGCFSPKTTYDNSPVKVIRPLVYTREGLIDRCAKNLNVPVTPKICPVDGETEREHFKELLRSEDRRHRGLYNRILVALERSEADGWRS